MRYLFDSLKTMEILKRQRLHQRIQPFIQDADYKKTPGTPGTEGILTPIHNDGLPQEQCYAFAVLLICKRPLSMSKALTTGVRYNAIVCCVALNEALVRSTKPVSLTIMSVPLTKLSALFDWSATI